MENAEKRTLKPCPFCGSEAEVCFADRRGLIVGDGFLGVVCKKCGATIKSRSQLKSIKDWNTRASQPEADSKEIIEVIDSFNLEDDFDIAARNKLRSKLQKASQPEAEKVKDKNIILAECFTMDDVRGALARGYCTKANENKTLDPTLLEDMVAELASLNPICNHIHCCPSPAPFETVRAVDKADMNSTKTNSAQGGLVAASCLDWTPPVGTGFIKGNL